MVESSELASALAVGSPDAHNSIPGFLLKLRVLVEDEGIDDIIHWGPGGITFVITNPVAFAEEILPIYFKHNHLASFIRQLNLYGFHKVTGVSDGGLVKTERECLEFRHPYFLRDKPEFLRLIKRKPTTQQHGKPDEKAEVAPKDISSQVPAIMSIANSVQQVMAKQAETDKKMATLKSENEVLWREVASLHRKNMQQSQMIDKIVRFLVKLVQRPHKARNAQMSPAAPGRPFPLMIDRPSTSGKEVGGLGGSKPRSISELHRLDTEPGADRSPSGPVIHDVTELLRTSDASVAVLGGDSYKPAHAASDATHLVMPTYVSVHSPGEASHGGASSSRAATASVGPTISTAAPASTEPEISMPMSVAPVEAMIDEGVGSAASQVGDVLILDPTTLTLHPAPTLSYIIDGKRIILNSDGTQSIIAVNPNEDQMSDYSTITQDQQGNLSISAPTSAAGSLTSAPSPVYVSAGKAGGQQQQGGKGKGKYMAGKKRQQQNAWQEEEPDVKRPLAKENDLRVAVPTSTNPFTFPTPATSFSVDAPSTSSAGGQNPSTDSALSSQFDIDKFLEYLTTSDAHFDVNELYKIVSDPSIVSKVSELDTASSSPMMGSSSSSRQPPLPVTSGSVSSPVKDMSGSNGGGKILPDLSELIDDGDTHESYYKGLEQNEFQSLDTPLVDGLD